MTIRLSPLPTKEVLFVLFFSLLGISSLGYAIEFKTFQPNSPANQNDYFSTDSISTKRVRTVERHHWDKARQHKERGEIQYAFGDIDFILRYVPNHPHALMQMSEISMAAGKPDTVRPYLDYAIQYRPKNSSTHIIYGIHLHRTKNYSEAVQHYKRALELDPKASETHYNLGLSYFELKEYTLAQKHAKIAYDRGYPLPGLKDKLRQLGHWPPQENSP
ncbi:MAG TPA: hypothetical protein DCZ03_05580 [Gammaproteobacteria bacterium]|nr:hypothetical protein [Gammaproteobacteria bacterium]